MVNVVIFDRAFKECGIGGPLSKFYLTQVGSHFSIHPRYGTPAQFVMIAHSDGFPYRRSSVTKISSRESLGLHKAMEWRSNIGTAQKVISRVATNKGESPDTQYYLDVKNQSVLLQCGEAYLEVSPITRVCTDVDTNTIFNYLDESGYTDIDDIKVFEVNSQVTLVANNSRINTGLSVNDITRHYGVN